jgi:hypothetical protein
VVIDAAADGGVRLPVEDVQSVVTKAVAVHQRLSSFLSSFTA